MHASIYARTYQKEKRHHTTSIPRQMEICQALASEHGLTVLDDHIYTDSEYPGHLPPTCWANGDEEGRPALSAMIAAIESGEINRVIVRRLEKLASASETLVLLLELFTRYDVYVIAPPEVAKSDAEPVARFAYSLLEPRVQLETDASRERRERQIAKKREEITRLQSKIKRIEAEIASI